MKAFQILKKYDIFTLNSFKYRIMKNCIDLIESNSQIIYNLKEESYFAYALLELYKGFT